MVPQALSAFWHQNRNMNKKTGSDWFKNCRKMYSENKMDVSMLIKNNIKISLPPQVINIAKRRRRLRLIVPPEGMEISQLRLHLVQTIMKNVFLFFSNFEYGRVNSEAEPALRCCRAAGGKMLPIRPASACKLNRAPNTRGKQQQQQQRQSRAHARTQADHP